MLNALIYIRGNINDFDLWCKKGNPGWCYKDVLPYFLKSEDFHQTDPDAKANYKFHGREGLLTVEYPMPRSEQVKVFFRACEEIGLYQTDPNGPYQIGASPFPVNTKHGRRQDTGTAFLRPVMKRENLVISTDSLVIKILVNATSREADGVLFSKDGTLYRALATKEVILCAGTINSAQLLMLSGIGPKNHLSRHSKCCLFLYKGLLEHFIFISTY